MLARMGWYNYFSWDDFAVVESRFANYGAVEMLKWYLMQCWVHGVGAKFGGHSGADKDDRKLLWHEGDKYWDVYDLRQNPKTPFSSGAMERFQKIRKGRRSKSFIDDREVEDRYKVYYPLCPYDKNGERTGKEIKRNMLKFGFYFSVVAMQEVEDLYDRWE